MPYCIYEALEFVGPSIGARGHERVFNNRKSHIDGVSPDLLGHYTKELQRFELEIGVLVPNSILQYKGP